MMTSHGLLERAGWALLVTEVQEPERFAEALHSSYPGVKPVAIQPARLTDAIAALHPVLIVVDGTLPHCNGLVRRASELCAGPTLVVTDRDLALVTGGVKAERLPPPVPLSTASNSCAACGSSQPL